MSLYRVAFDVEPKTVPTVLDFLSTVKSFNVEWDVAGALHRVSFLVGDRGVASVLSFVADHRVHNMQWPVPAMEVQDAEERMPITAVINLKGKKQVTTAELKHALVEHGRSPGSVSYLSKALREAGLIRYHNGVSTTGIYDVVPSKKKKAPSKKKAKKPAKKIAKKVKAGELTNVEK